MRWRATAALCLLFAAGAASAKNTAECIIDDMPGVANDAAANAIMQVCFKKYGNFATVKRGSGRGIFGYESGAACTADEARDTRSARGATLIGTACRLLYDAPVESWEPQYRSATPPATGGPFDDLVPQPQPSGREKPAAVPPATVQLFDVPSSMPHSPHPCDVKQPTQAQAEECEEIQAGNRKALRRHMRPDQ